MQKLVEQLHKWEAEAKGLVLQVERVQLTNEELNRTVDKLRDAGMRKLAAHDPEIRKQPTFNCNNQDIYW